MRMSIDREWETSDWAMPLEKAMCWVVAGLMNDCAALDWYSDRAGDAHRGVSETFRRDTQRGATQHNKNCDRTLQMADKPMNKKRETGVGNDERWYLLLCNCVHLGVGDKMSAFNVNLWFHGHTLGVVICKLLCHWRIRELQR